MADLPADFNPNKYGIQDDRNAAAAANVPAPSRSAAPPAAEPSPPPPSGSVPADFSPQPAAAPAPAPAQPAGPPQSVGSSIRNLVMGAVDTSSPEAIKLAQERDPTWKPTGNAVADFMSYPRAKSEGVGQAATDAGLVAADTVSGGYVRKVIDPDRIDQAHANMGPIMDTATQGLAYAALPGQVLGGTARGIVGGGAKLAGLGLEGSTAARLGASAVSGGLEGAGANAYGTLGHGGTVGDALKNAAIGFGTGAATGAVGGQGPAVKGPTAEEIGQAGKGVTSAGATGMYADKAAGYAPLDSIYFDKSAPIRDANAAMAAIRTARNPQGLPGVDLNVPADAKKIVTDLVSAPTVTGRNIQQAIFQLKNNFGNDPAAHQLGDALQNTLATATPLQGSMMGTAAAKVGDAAKAKAAGDLWNGRIQDLNTLGTDPGELTKGDINAVKSWPQNAPGTPQGEALSALQAKMAPGFNAYTARHIAAPLLGAATGAAEGAMNPAEGQNRWTNAGIHAFEDAMLFGGFHAAATPRPGSALGAARYAIATGKPALTRTSKVGDLLANAIYGSAAAGQTPY